MLSSPQLDTLYQSYCAEPEEAVVGRVHDALELTKGMLSAEINEMRITNGNISLSLGCCVTGDPTNHVISRSRLSNAALSDVVFSCLVADAIASEVSRRK